MILFFGTRPGKRKSKYLLSTECSHCRQIGTLQALKVPNYFHLFWIPIFKVYTSHLLECDHCKKVYFKEEFTPEMKKAFDNM